jgi:hypothetical protein
MRERYDIDAVISGYFDLLIAVLELAEKDARLDPTHYQNEESKAKAERYKESGTYFLQDMKAYRLTQRESR